MKRTIALLLIISSCLGICLPSFAELRILKDSTVLRIANNSNYTHWSQIQYYVREQSELNAIETEIITTEFIKIIAFNTSIKDSTGKVVKTFGTSDLDYNGQTNMLASDFGRYILPLFSPVFPAVITVTMETKCSGQTSLLPIYYPQRWDARVDTAIYSVECAKDLSVKFNIECPELTQAKEETTGNTKRYSWKYHNLPHYKIEEYSKYTHINLPIIRVQVENFRYGNTTGSFSSWKDLGEWTWLIMRDRCTLAPKYQEEIRALCKGIEEPREKVRILYQYLQKKSHYQSIQLGIGGHQPMNVNQVHKTGYGDCKALSSYMRAMLEAVDIPAHYTLVNTKNPELLDNFPSLTQMNHAIVCVPFPKDTLWLECTSSLMPFDYIGKHLAGHQVLLVDSKLSSLARIGYNPIDTAVLKSWAVIHLDTTGKALEKIHFRFYNELLEDFIPFVHIFDSESQTNYLAKQCALPNLYVKKYQYTLSKGKPQYIDIFAEIESEALCIQSEKRIFFALKDIDLVSKKKWAHTRTERINPFVFTETGSELRRIELILPETYTLENIPKPLSIKTKWGNYFLNVEHRENRLFFTESYELTLGLYPASEWNDFCNFHQRIYQETNQYVVLRKKEIK